MLLVVCIHRLFVRKRIKYKSCRITDDSAIKASCTYERFVFAENQRKSWKERRIINANRRMFGSRLTLLRKNAITIECRCYCGKNIRRDSEIILFATRWGNIERPILMYCCIIVCCIVCCIFYSYIYMRGGVAGGVGGRAGGGWLFSLYIKLMIVFVVGMSLLELVKNKYYKKHWGSYGLFDRFLLVALVFFHNFLYYILYFTIFFVIYIYFSKRGTRGTRSEKK